jgi:hypothetical protein
MTHPALALQKAIHAALLADAAVGALVGDRIYDAAPRDAAFPYVAYGAARAGDWSTGTEAGAEHRVLIHLWSRERGKRECLAIAEAVAAALHDQVLTLDGHALVNLRVEATDVARDPDGITWHGVMRVRAVTEAA